MPSTGGPSFTQKSKDTLAQKRMSIQRPNLLSIIDRTNLRSSSRGPWAASVHQYGRSVRTERGREFLRSLSHPSQLSKIISSAEEDEVPRPCFQIDSTQAYLTPPLPLPQSNSNLELAVASSLLRLRLRRSPHPAHRSLLLGAWARVALYKLDRSLVQCSDVHSKPPSPLPSSSPSS